jgi:hypothetical protein
MLLQMKLLDSIWYKYIYNAHAQRIMPDGGIILAGNFEELLLWYCKELEEFRAVTRGIAAIQNFSNFFPAIQQL